MTTTVTARPTPVNLSLYAGDDFALAVTVLNADSSPADLTGMIVKADIRTNTDSAVLASFTATITGNIISLHLAGTATAVLPGSAVWDCELIGLITQTVAAGTVRTAAQVTI